MADQMSKADDTLGVGAVESSLVGDSEGQMKVLLPQPHDQNEKKEKSVVGKVCLLEDDGGLNKLGNNSSSQTHSNDSHRGGVTEIKVSGNDISLVFEVQVSSSPSAAAAAATTVVQDIGSELMSGKSSLTPSRSEVRERNSREKKKVLENGEHLSAKVVDADHDLPVIKGSLGDEEEKEVVGDQGGGEEEDHGFSVGDFVWGKIKNQPWWPGQIYSPSDASECAAKYQPKRNPVLLVAYFGVRSYAWCYPHQLKPFQEKNFEEMVMQSKSRRFLDAVKEAVDEIGKNVESIMTCSCVQMEPQVGAVKPLAVNPGIKEGVPVPNCAIDEFLVTHLEPAKFLEILRFTAQFVSPTSMLELQVFQKQLLAFYRSRGCGQMPTYHIIPEDNGENGKVKNTDFNGEIGDLNLGPSEEHWLSSPKICGFGNNSKEKWPEISEDKLYHRKKQRNMVDILADDVDVEPEKCESDVAEEENVGKKMLASRKKKKKKKKKKEKEIETESYLDDQDGLGSGNSVSQSKKKKRKKKAGLLGSPSEMAEKEETNTTNADFRGREENISRSLSRERKKSKYLSPPYTNLSSGHKSWILPDDSAFETPKVSKRSRVGEIMRKATGHVLGSPPFVKCSGMAFDEKLLEESFSYPTLEEKNLVFILSSEEIYDEFITTSLDTMYLKGNRSSRSVKGFLTAYRSSLYVEGSNYKRFKDFMTDQCDETIEFSENTHCSLRKIANGTNHPTSNDKSKAKRTEGEEGEKMLHGPTSQPKRIKRKDDKMPQDPKSEASKRRKKNEEKMPRDPNDELERIEKKDDKIPQDPKSEAPKRRKKKEEKMPQDLNSEPDRIEMKDENMVQDPNSELTRIKRKYEKKLQDPNSEPARIKRKYEKKSQDPNSEPKRIKKTDEKMLENPNGKTKRIRRKGEKKLQSPNSEPAHNVTVTVDANQNNTKDQILLSSMELEENGTPANQPTAQSPVGEPTSLTYVKQKLQMMTSMLERSGDELSPEMNAKLEHEIKGLLNKVTTKGDSSSS